MSDKSKDLFKGLGKGPAKGCGHQGKARSRRSKIYLNTIKGISKGAIRRLARKGGVRRMADAVVSETRAVLKVFLSSIIREAYLYMDFAKRKTITATDVMLVLNRRGTVLLGFESCDDL